MFRDTFTVEMLLAGVPLEQVSILLGYKSIKITEKHYAPLGQSSTRAACCQCRKAWTVLKRRWQEVWPEATAEGEDCLKRRKSTTQIQLAHRSLLCTRRRTISGTPQMFGSHACGEFRWKPTESHRALVRRSCVRFSGSEPRAGKNCLRWTVQRLWTVSCAYAFIPHDLFSRTEGLHGN